MRTAIQHQSFPDPRGQLVPTRHFSTLGTGGTEYKGCGHPDPGHGWESGRAQLHGGFLAEGSGNDEFALTYFNQGELGFIHEAARNYTLYDRYFCSLLASTWPNRYYKWSAQSGGLKNNDRRSRPAGNQWETIFDRALGARPERPLLRLGPAVLGAVWGARGAAWTNPITRYYADCAAGTLPNIAIVDPPFRDGGGGDGLSADEHPLGDVRLGQAFMADVVNAFVQLAQLPARRAVRGLRRVGRLLRPRAPAERRRRPGERATSTRTSARWASGSRRRGLAVRARQRRTAGARHFRVDHGLYGHESILKLISYRFGLGDLTKRMRRQQHRPQLRLGAARLRGARLPDPPEIVTAPCALGGGDVLDSQEAHASDLADARGAAPSASRVPVYEGKPATSSPCRTRSSEGIAAPAPAATAP